MLALPAAPSSGAQKVAKRGGGSSVLPGRGRNRGRELMRVECMIVSGMNEVCKRRGV